MEPSTVADLGEFGLIDRVCARLDAPPPPAGPGDDAAVVAAADGRVVATTDLLVEGVHFRFDWSDPYDVGAKAAAANLADVAAMGARATALLLGVSLPGSTPLDVVDRLVDGLRDECARAGATVVGGDTVSGDRITVAITALGDLDGRAPVLRSTTRPGTLVVAGPIGHSAAGLD
ncbi:MAG: AIR synthase related protein, partial [Mycobacteriales bacterium]